MATQVEKPPVTQRINQRVFAGFTPQQVARLFEGKNIQPNSREGAELLAKATKTATKTENKKAAKKTTRTTRKKTLKTND